MFSNSCRNAIRATLYLARNSDESNKFSIDDIAKELDISRHFLAKSLQQLSKKSIISSVRGPNGGFYLSKGNKKLNLLAVISCIDGTDVLDQCVLGLPNCSNDNPCPFHEHVRKFRDDLKKLLENENVEEIARKIDLNDLRF